MASNMLAQNMTTEEWILASNALAQDVTIEERSY
jgi:hypothetical protein